MEAMLRGEYLSQLKVLRTKESWVKAPVSATVKRRTCNSELAAHVVEKGPGIEK